MGNLIRCKLCGRQIQMMHTQKGKTMPCEIKVVRFIPDLNGPNKYLTDELIPLRGTEPAPGDLDVHVGFIDHRCVCPARKGGSK